jgi:hypothetical protein
MEKRTLEIAFDIVSNYAQENKLHLEPNILLNEMMDMGIDEVEIDETMNWLETCFNGKKEDFAKHISLIYLMLYQQVKGLNSHDFDRIIKECRLLENDAANLNELRYALELLHKNYQNEKKVPKNYMNNTDLKH